jgi:transcriptional regulator with XRE-family HTH domain
MTQEELAGRAGISADVVRKLEQHRKDSVRLETLRKLAQGLQADPASLLNDPHATLTAEPPSTAIGQIAVSDAEPGKGLAGDGSSYINWGGD